MKISSLLAVLLAGCASAPSFKAANCERFRYKDYNILVCDDKSVGIYCAKGDRLIGLKHTRSKPIADNGKPVYYEPRACYNPRGYFFNRKGNLIVGRSFTACIPHEICHIENPQDAAMCEQKYPCVGEREK